MSAKNPEEEIAIVYGRKDLVEYFVEQFNMDRLHDGEKIKAILLKGEMKKCLKNSIKDVSIK